MVKITDVVVRTFFYNKYSVAVLRKVAFKSNALQYGITP